MVVVSSGPLSLTEIGTEFGDSAPYVLTDLYRGGSRVPNISTNVGVASGGALNMAGFYGARTGVAGTVGPRNDGSVSVKGGIAAGAGPKQLVGILIPAGVANLVINFQLRTSSSSGGSTSYPHYYVKMEYPGGSYTLGPFNRSTGSNTYASQAIYTNANPNLSSSWFFTVTASVWPAFSGDSASWYGDGTLWASYVT